MFGSIDFGSGMWFLVVLLKLVFCSILVLSMCAVRSARQRRKENEGRFQQPVFKGWPAGVTPRRKLFLSWEAVFMAVRSGYVPAEDLDICLFCTSFSEFNQAQEHDRYWFDRLHPAFVKAAQEGRLVFSSEAQRYNPTTLKEVNELLERNGVAQLSCDPQGSLDMMPNYIAVPRVSDESVEVMWAAHPMRCQWVRWFGYSNEETHDFIADITGKEREPLADRLVRMKNGGKLKAVTK